MRLAGLPGEGRRYGEERGASLGHRAIERRETQIVTDRQAEPAPWQVGDNGKLASAIIVGFAVTLAAGKLDVEHMNLVVARGHVALAVDHERAVHRLFRRRLDRQRTDMDVDLKLARKVASVGSCSSATILANRSPRLRARILVISGVST